MSDLSFLACALDPTLDCLRSPRAMFPLVMAVILVGLGFFARRIHLRAFRRMRTLALRVSVTLLGLTALASGYFLIFDRASVDGVTTAPLAESLWVAAVSGLGGAVAMVAATLALSLGGWLAKKRRPSKALPGTARPMRARPDSGLVVAIDGPAASGKGTLAKRVAAHYGLHCLDTGLLYRAVARDVMLVGAELTDVAAAVTAATALDPTSFDDPGLRGPAAGDAASIVARIPAVRTALLEFQRNFARCEPGAVLDGRDIGTVVCPNATVKIFVTATAEERARRRHAEYEARGDDISYADVLADIQRRDTRDSRRDIAPMGAAADAVIIETTDLDADAVFAKAIAIIDKEISSA